MDKTIVCLLAAGLALAVLHIPSTMIHLAIIVSLLLGTIKLLWAVLQRFVPNNQDISLR